MKKITVVILITLSIILINACQSRNELTINIDFDNYVATTDNENIDVSLSVLENSFLLEVIVPSSEIKYNLVVNDKKVSSNKYDFSNNKISYNFKLSDFLKSEDDIKYQINFDLPFGVYSKEDITKFDPQSTFIITEKNNQFEYEFSVFNKTKTGLKFHYKVFLKHYKEIDVYQPVYVDQMANNIEDVVGFDYDYIVTYNNHLDFEGNDELRDFFSDKVLESTIVTDKDFFDLGEVNMSVYKHDSILFVVDGESNIELPSVYLENVAFNGWLWNNESFVNLPKLKVKDNINFINLKPDWELIEVNDLYKHLDKVIPTILKDDITLPTYFSGYNISWQSSDISILTNQGEYNTPYNNKNLTLTVTLNDILGNEYQKIYELETNSKKSLEVPIASSYVYTSYQLVDDLFFETLDIINTAFLTADDNGNLNGLNVLDNINKYIMPEAKKNGNWVVLSIAPESSWSVFSKTQEKINIFANNIVNIINEYGFDGVDIDWETPKPGEEKQYTNLMKVVYEKVKQNNVNHLVTTAITGGPWQAQQYDLHNSNQYIDYLNIMTYGMITGGGGYQNALYTHTSFHHQEFRVGNTINRVSIDDSIKIFNDYGFNNNQLIVGVAFYSMKQTRTETNDTWSAWRSAGSGYYQNMINLTNDENYEEFYDERAKVPYIVKKDGTEFFSYDNERSIIDKSSYVKENNLGGIMFWEYGRDNTNRLLGAIKQGLNK